MKRLAADLLQWAFGLVRSRFWCRPVAVVSKLLRVECCPFVALPEPGPTSEAGGGPGISRARGGITVFS